MDNFPKLRRGALDSLSAQMPAMPGVVRDIMHSYLDQLADPEVHSFLLPEDGLMLGADTASQLTLANCRLPFPSCVLEYSIDPAYWNNRRGNVAFFPTDTLLMVTQFADRLRCVAVWRQRNSDLGDVWIPTVYGFEVDEHSVIHVKEDLEVAIENVKTISAPGAPDCPHEEILGNYSDEMRVLAQFALLCNCGNVKAEKIYTPPAKLVKRARERGKLPPDDYYVLDCFLGENRETARESQGTHHASPRFHVRRGHVRRLSADKLTWVRSAKVGNAALGRIDKSYRMHGPRRPA